MAVRVGLDAVQHGLHARVRRQRAQRAAEEALVEGRGAGVAPVVGAAQRVQRLAHALQRGRRVHRAAAVAQVGRSARTSTVSASTSTLQIMRSPETMRCRTQGGTTEKALSCQSPPSRQMRCVPRSDR